MECMCELMQNHHRHPLYLKWEGLCIGDLDTLGHRCVPPIVLKPIRSWVVLRRRTKAFVGKRNPECDFTQSRDMTCWHELRHESQLLCEER